MNTYITQVERDGRPFAGSRVRASSWDEAEDICTYLEGVILYPPSILTRIMSGVLALWFLLVFAGCAGQTPTAMQLRTADCGPYPHSYKSIIKAQCTKDFYDPYSAVFTFNEPRWAWDNVGGLKFGWAVCGTVNGKNRFGGYTGAKPFYVMINNGRVVTSIIGDNIWSESDVNILCERVYK